MPVAPEAPKAAAAAVRASGLAVGLSFGSRLALLAPDDSAPVGLPGGLLGQILVGYRRSRVTVGLGFSVGHLGSSATYVAGTSQSTIRRSDTGFQFAPTLQLDLVRSSDRRVELYAGFQVGLGTTITQRSVTPSVPESYLPSPDEHNFQLSYQAGPGLRYWVHPQLALSLAAGLSGDHVFEIVSAPSGRRAERYDFLGMYGALGGLGVF